MLPEDDIPPELLTLKEDGEMDFEEADSKRELSGDSHSFLPLPRKAPTEDNAIWSMVNGSEPVDWPDIGRQPINEFRTPGLATMAFPALSLMVLVTQHIQCDVLLTDGFKLLIKYGEDTHHNLH